MEAGKMGCDILMVAEPSYSLELKDEGLLHPYMFSEADKLDFEYDREGYWYPVRTLNMVLAYNPDLNDKADLPCSFEDFAKNRDMKGRISMSDPLSSGTAYSTMVALLDKYGEEYFKELGQQDVAVESGSVAVSKLETGECKEIMVLEESILKKRQEEGSSLEVIYPDDGCVLIPSTIMIIDEKHSANNNIPACEAIEEYYLSIAGQRQILKGWMNGVRTDLNETPYDGRPLSELIKMSIPVDWEKSYKQRDDIRTMFQEDVTQ
jgi:iron(III) transport system substrate-binding protein